MAITNYLKDSILDADFTGRQPFTMPPVFVGLSATTPNPDASNVTEPSTGAYARVATTGSTWNAANLGSTANAATIGFARATADWASAAPLGNFVGYDAPTGGNLLWYGSFPARAVLNGDQPFFPIGSILHALGVKTLSAALASSSTMSAALSTQRGLATTSTSSTAISSQLVRVRGIVSAISDATTITARLGKNPPLAAALIDATNITASLATSRALAAALADMTSITAVLGKTLPLAASLTSATTTTSVLGVTKFFSAAEMSMTSITASMIKAKFLASALTSATTTSALLGRVRPLAASLSSATTITAALTVPLRFDPSNKGADIALSNANLTATLSVGATEQVIVNKGWTSGKFYFEASETKTGTGTNRVGQIGIAQLTTAGFKAGTTSSGRALGQSADSFGFNDTGTYDSGAGVNISAGGPAFANTMGIAYDVGAGRIWIKNVTTGGNWNGNATYDPGTGVGGIDVTGGQTSNLITGAATHPIYAAIGISLSGTFTGSIAMTINLGGTSFVGTIPTGFVAYNS